MEQQANDVNMTQSEPMGSTPDMQTQEPMWFDGLPDDLKTSPNVTKYKTLEDALRWQDNASKLVGKRVNDLTPDELKNFIDPEELKNIYRAKDMPASLEDFSLPTLDPYLDPDVSRGLKEKAMSAGLSPSQVEQMAQFHFESQKMVAMKEQEAWLNESQSRFSKDEINHAKRAVMEFGGNDFKKHLDASGLGNHPMVIEVFAKVGAAMAEDRIPATAAASMQHDAAQVRDEIKSLLNNREFKQKWNQQNPEAVNKMNNLYKRLHTLEAV